MAESGTRSDRPLGRTAGGLVLLAALSLLGQGERCRIDPMLRTPGLALASYWQALQLNDVERLAALAEFPTERLPFPGMQWNFPPTRALWIEQVRCQAMEDGRVLAHYRVGFLPTGSAEPRSLDVVTELARVRGEWRIAHPLAESGLLNGEPSPPRVDI